LSDRERIVLESRLRYEKTFDCVAQDIGMCKASAGKIYSRAIARLKHTPLGKRMRISQIEEERDNYQKLYLDSLVTINDLEEKARLIAYRMPVKEEYKSAFAKFDISIMDIDFPPPIKSALIRAKKDTVESILAIATFEKMIELPRIGTKTAITVITIMRDLGFNEWAENMMAGAIQHDASLAELVTEV
jgi:hypothetical protein